MDVGNSGTMQTLQDGIGTYHTMRILLVLRNADPRHCGVGSAGKTPRWRVGRNRLFCPDLCPDEHCAGTACRAPYRISNHVPTARSRT